MKTVNPDDAAQQRFMQAAVDRRPIIMVNLLRFRERADYGDGGGPAISGREAYQRYVRGVLPLLWETGEQLLVDTHDAGFRRRFARIAAQREAELRQSFVQAGVDTLELSTDDDLVQTVMRFADLRKRRSRLSGASAVVTNTRAVA